MTDEERAEAQIVYDYVEAPYNWRPEYTPHEELNRSKRFWQWWKPDHVRVIRAIKYKGWGAGARVSLVTHPFSGKIFEIRTPDTNSEDS